VVEVLPPLTDHDRRHRVAQHVDEHPALVEDPGRCRRSVPARPAAHARSRSTLLASTTNAPPATPAVPLLVNIMMPGQVNVHRLRQEQRRHGEVNRRTVEVEREPQRYGRSRSTSQKCVRRPTA
jgi:hypothetical protein